MRYSDVDALIPYRPTPDGCRQRNADFVQRHLSSTLSGCRVTRCDDPDPDLFNRGRATNAGVYATDRPIILVMDADVWIPPGALREAVEVLRRTYRLPRSYVVPFDKVVWLDREWSDGVLAGRFPIASRPPKRNVVLEWGQSSVGICTVVRRDQFEAIGGFDPRFRGWGCEDVAWDAAASTLVGPHLRLHAEGRHLYHPPCPSKEDPDRMRAAGSLLSRYGGARDDRRAMAALIAEGKAVE